MGDLSENFSRWEFVCPCCGEVRVDEQQVLNLEALRRAADDTRVHVTSGFRCKAYNAMIGGAENSQHLLGRAADIQVHDKHRTMPSMFVAILANGLSVFEHGGIGLYVTLKPPLYGHVHVDARQIGRARWGYVEGKKESFVRALMAAVQVFLRDLWNGKGKVT